MSDGNLPPEPEDLALPRWVQIPAGLFLLAVSLACLAGSVTLIFDPNDKAPVLRPVFGIVMSVACFWLIGKCVRLVFGKRMNGGLMTPRALRIVAWFFLLLPLGGLFTGYFLTHTIAALIQTAAYISIFFGLHRLAAFRDANDA